MHRRTLLAALALAPIAGCVAPGDTATASDQSTPTATPTAEPAPPTMTAPPDDPILFVVHNGTDDELTVSVAITHDGTTVLDETVTLAADETAEYDPDIHAPGAYALTVAVDGGPTRSRDLPIDRYDVRAGSNHYVEIYPDDIQIFAEE
ncbi:hypothetical protein HISP_04925 [Haloarcula hispanica N601]|uniref:Ig-like domain-containing protein n=3 Tax=Haloarcula hispanica TaxID=51589 RepID=V5TJV1_HALHI|nr:MULTISPECIES: hypothetical protein [Haloarcula]AEM56576.1 conserved hypothetical protein [Haloarcula hispanica ATCC 33960]AHB65378.1 hypothetical protein HISP_04925 [Haloarcula hispanica N601]KZX48233.1 hypothetical protein AV929_11095 [Haloarcula sp. K1]MCJ0618339.1 hypothetical protein [Haloarcula hispanica]RYJ08943.1 hypothetical protein ELS20_02055 [Haloarcula hispanica]